MPDPDQIRPVRHSIAQYVLLGLVTGYQWLLSPLLGGSCRFVPSCSDYARAAIVEHGAVKGSWLAARRLARCHPAGSYGLDPVPPRTRAHADGATR
jgi:putative membrane protein insertion efficiency factor